MSTGAIIATLVSLGYSVEEIRDFYLKTGAEMFHKARLWERFRTIPGRWLIWRATGVRMQLLSSATFIAFAWQICRNL